MNKLFVVILAVVAFASVALAGTAEFDQDCEKTEDCLDDSFLYCNQYKKCACIPDIPLIHDRQAKKCAIGMGSSCHLVAETGEPSCTTNSGCVTKDWVGPGKGLCTCVEGTNYPPNELRCLKKAVPIGEYCETGHSPDVHNCTGSSTCQSGLCKCTLGHAPSLGICVWAPNAYDQPCTDNIECNHRKSISCGANNKCSCMDPASMVYNATTEECLTKVGEGSCDLQPNGEIQKMCVPNADCLPTTANPLIGECRCKTGFQPNADKMCAPSGGVDGGATTNFLAAPVILVFGILQAML